MSRQNPNYVREETERYVQQYKEWLKNTWIPVAEKPERRRASSNTYQNQQYLQPQPQPQRRSRSNPGTTQQPQYYAAANNNTAAQYYAGASSYSNTPQYYSVSQPQSRYRQGGG